MYGYCPDAQSLKFGLERIVETASKSLSEAVAKLSNTSETRFHEAQHFMSWNAISMTVEMTHARHATDVLAWADFSLEKLAETGWTQEQADAQWYENVKSAALRRCMRSTNPASRSTSPASNAAEDAELSFWQKMLEATHRL